ncbi:MAG TPA: polysaccharide deacetylase family protein [Terriglobales bacterium]|nr:polysaccharide deacetylase family protein [Terriglobales bacterium]
MKRAQVLLTFFLLAAPLAAAQQKLIALTFDDGPRPYVLLGIQLPPDKVSPSLLALLDKNHVRATFFVVGWRLTKNSQGAREEPKLGITCLAAAKEVVKRGHELENHTFSHLNLEKQERREGLTWVLEDVDKESKLLQALTGKKPRFLRPPDWLLSADARKHLESRGYQVMTITAEAPPALRDVNTLDYQCAGEHPQHCPRPSLADSVERTITEREKRGLTTHILAFHELSSTVRTLETLIPELQARGYRFVTLSEYMQAVKH